MPTHRTLVALPRTLQGLRVLQHSTSKPLVVNAVHGICLACRMHNRQPLLSLTRSSRPLLPVPQDLRSPISASRSRFRLPA